MLPLTTPYRRPVGSKNRSASVQAIGSDSHAIRGRESLAFHASITASRSTSSSSAASAASRAVGAQARPLLVGYAIGGPLDGGGRRKTSAAGANAGAPSASETPSTKSSSVSSENDAKGKDGWPSCAAWKSAKRPGGTARPPSARAVVRSSRDVGRYVAE